MMIRQRQLREFMAITVVALHIVLVFYVILILPSRITNQDTLASTIGAFLPVFGIYVGIVVKNLQLRRGPIGEKVNPSFTIVLVMLLAAYVAGIVFVVEGYKSGVLTSERLLPGAIGLVEAAFGGFFSSLFFTLFGVDGSNSKKMSGSPRK